MNKILFTITFIILFAKTNGQNRFDTYTNNSNNQQNNYSPNQSNNNYQQYDVSSDDTPTELDLYDTDGNAVIYICIANTTFYDWRGTPLGYLENDAIYTFSGKQVGWFSSKGVIVDNEGYVVAFMDGAVNMPLNPKSLKWPKSPVPMRSLNPPLGPKPYISMIKSSISISIFFR